MGNPNPKINHLISFPRLPDAEEACSIKPVQVKIPKSQYSEWMTLPAPIRNQVLREAIAEALQNKESLVVQQSR
jgi:D-aminopeptidase